MREILKSNGFPDPKHLSVLNDAKRAFLAEIESKADGQPNHPTVVQLREARNRVYDDLRFNEQGGHLATAGKEAARGN